MPYFYCRMSNDFKFNIENMYHLLMLDILICR